METRLLIFAGLVMLSICSSVIAAPTVSGVSGTISEGSTITITGSGFGTTGPNIILFDDFEKGTNGQAIRTGAGSAQIGQWDENARPDNSRAIYSSVTSVSGSLSFRADQVDSWPQGQPTIIRYLQPNMQDLFISYWTMIPAGDRWPGEGTTDTTNWKIIWVLGESTVDDDLILPGFMGDNGCVVGCNECAYDLAHGGNPWIDFNIKKGEWKRVWAWVKARPDTTGSVQLYTLDPSQGVVTEINDQNVQVFNAQGDKFEQVNVNGYGRTTDNSHPIFDDVYIASNPARIEIGNAATYAASTKLTVFTATSWSGSQVQSTGRLGQFRSGVQAYLYVFDSTNSHNAVGYPVTIGTGGGITAVCGNGIIESGEQCDDSNTRTENCTYSQTSCTVCSSTCQNTAGATSYCGDSQCKSPETQASCSVDCGSPAVCGNGNCDAGETCTSCSIDCGSCSTTCSDTAVCQNAVFCSGFEEGNKDIWDDYDGNPDTENQIITDVGPCNAAGNHVMRFRVPAGRGGSDLVKVFPPNDRLYARWYQKWEPGYDFSAANHGSGLNAGSRDYLGQSDYRPNGDDFFGTWIEPDAGDPALNGRPNLYSYYRGMYQDCADPNGQCWGDHFPCMYSDTYCEKAEHKGQTPVLQTGKWYCIEIMLDAGTPVQSDAAANGVQGFWIDGTEYGPFQHLWHRTSVNVKPDILWLSLFHHGEHSVEGTMYDNVVVSTQRIGCLGSPAPVQKCTEADTDTSGSISMAELNAYIAKWKAGQANLASLMEVIRQWKKGC